MHDRWAVGFTRRGGLTFELSQQEGRKKAGRKLTVRTEEEEMKKERRYNEVRSNKKEERTKKKVRVEKNTRRKRKE